MVYKFKIFISSVINNFESYRLAASQVITALSCEPILVNEDFPSSSNSSRNVCLDAVTACDIFVLLIGERGGWIAPSGKLVVEEELDEARKRGKPILVFIQDTKRDRDALALVDNVIDYIDGYFVTKFKGVDDLKSLLKIALLRMVSDMNILANVGDTVNAHLDKDFQIGNDETVRLAIIPERKDQVFDPLEIDSEDFKNKLLEIGSNSDVGLFSHLCKKEIDTGAEHLVIKQTRNCEAKSNHHVRFYLSQTGMILVDSAVESICNDYINITDQDILRGLEPAFKCLSKLYQEFDPYKRFQSFFYNAAICGVEYRGVIFERDRKLNNGSPSMKKIIYAYNEAQMINLSRLNSASKEANRCATMIVRRSQESHSF
ncbi:MAG: DUF4062 domain-containing protein [Oligoflexales bacterium]